MAEHTITIDLQKVAQDIQNIKHFLNHLEALLEKGIAEGRLKDEEKADLVLRVNGDGNGGSS